MPQISKGDTFTNGEQVTATRLNQLVDSSQILVGAISEQVSINANTVALTDQTIINDGGVLKKATIGDLLNSNLPITTSSVSGTNSSDIVITPPTGKKVDVAGAFEADSINSTGNTTVGGNASVTGTLNVTGVSTLGSASATSLTIGGKTPMTVQDNAIRVYVKSGFASGATGGGGVQYSVYSLPTLPTIPSDETWTYEFYLYATAGNANGNTRPTYGAVNMHIYNDTTLIVDVMGSSSPYGGESFCAFHSLTAVSGAKYIIKISSQSGQSVEPRYMVKLIKQKTSSISDASTCI